MPPLRVPSPITRLLSLWRYLTHRARTERDLDEELAAYVELVTDEKVRAGLSPAQARRAALIETGGIEQTKEEVRAVRAGVSLETLLQDLRYAARQLLRSPALTTIATLTIALAVGANTAIFSVVDAVLLQPLPYAHAERLMLLTERRDDGTDGNVSIGNFVDWRARSHSFTAMSAEATASFNLTAAGEPQRIPGARVTASFFRTGYIPPRLGRYFSDQDDQPGAPHVVVLSYPLWQRQFGGDRYIIGREIELNGERHTIVGVTPEDYTLTSQDEQLWVPAAFTPDQIAQHDEHYLDAFGLLAPGVTREAAQRELSAIEHDLHDRYPRTGTPARAGVLPLREILVRSYRTQLLVLLGAVTFVLLIACGNVANLLLARATVRAKELAIRAALGAGRRRLVRQLLTESLALALLGGTAGLAVAHLGIRFLITMSPAAVPRLGQATLSPTVLAFTLILTLACGVAFGLAPALRTARPDLQATLKEGARGSSLGGSRDRLRNALVVAELAVALVLCVGAGLLIRSSLALQRVNPGFDPTNVLSFRMSLPRERYADPARASQTFQQILDQVSTLPGIRSAALVSTAPFGGGGQNGLIPEGRSMDDKSAILSTLRLISPGYFEAMRLPLRRGRAFTDRDTKGHPRVMVVNETLARLAWPGESPLGKRIACCEGGPNDTTVAWKEVVGVVADVHAWGLASDVRPEFYLPLAQAPADAWNWIDRTMTIVARTAASPLSLTRAAQRAVWAVDPTIPLYQVRTLDEAMARTTAATRFNMLLLTLLGATGLVLAAVGIYGVIGYLVSQRTHELGIRMALGASATSVQQMVVRQGAVLAVLGVTIGIAASLAMTRALASLLFGVTPRDPVTLIGVATFLAVVAVAATYLPARRATRIDPLTALRVG